MVCEYISWAYSKPFSDTILVQTFVNFFPLPNHTNSLNWAEALQRKLTWAADSNSWTTRRIIDIQKKCNRLQQYFSPAPKLYSYFLADQIGARCTYMGKRKVHIVGIGTYIFKSAEC